MSPINVNSTTKVLYTFITTLWNEFFLISLILKNFCFCKNFPISSCNHASLHHSENMFGWDLSEVCRHGWFHIWSEWKVKVNTTDYSKYVHFTTVITICINYTMVFKSKTFKRTFNSLQLISHIWQIG